MEASRYYRDRNRSYRLSLAGKILCLLVELTETRRLAAVVLGWELAKLE